MPTLGLVGDLRPGHGERQPAGVRRARRSRRAAGRRRAELVVGLAAGRVSGRAVPLGPVPVFNLQSPGNGRRKSRRNQLDLLASLNRGISSGIRRNRNWRRGSRISKPPRDANRRPGRRSISRRRRKPRGSCTVSTTPTRRNTARAACWRGGWSSRACGSCRSSCQASRGTRTARTPRVDQALRGPISRARRWSHDLKQRGLLDRHIVLWTGEFGRQPISQGADGRDHNRRAFSLWLAGGGFERLRSRSDRRLRLRIGEGRRHRPRSARHAAARTWGSTIAS